MELSRSPSLSPQRRKELDAPAAQPGTVAIPDSAQNVVMRLSNAAAGLNDQNRVQNEVAAMSLARKALAPRQIPPSMARQVLQKIKVRF